MFCPKCGCEYRTGYSRCFDCQIDLVEEKPSIIHKENGEVSKLKMGLKNHKMGLISFLLSMMTIGWIVITVLRGILFPNPFSMDFEKNTFIETNILLFINVVGLVMGVVSLSKYGYKKTLAIWGIVINSLIPVTIIISILKVIIK